MTSNKSGLRFVSSLLSYALLLSPVLAQPEGKPSAASSKKSTEGKTSSSTTDAKKVLAKSGETKSQEAKSSEAKSAEVKSADTKAKVAKKAPNETKSKETKSSQNKSSEVKTGEAKAAESKSVLPKSADAKSVDAKSATAKPAEVKKAESRPSDSKAADSKTADVAKNDLEAGQSGRMAQSLPSMPSLKSGSSGAAAKPAAGVPEQQSEKATAAQVSTETRPTTAGSKIIQRALAGKVQETTLPNGLKILLVEAPEFPVVSCLVWYRVGSRDEDPGHTGLSHMVEHLLFGNVGSFKSGDMGSAIARFGGQFNGYTSDDFITFFETLPSNKLEMALKIESERMRGAKFDEKEVQSEIKNIQAELDSESKDAVAVLSKEVRGLVFMQHPYHNPTIGWRSDLANLHAEDARKFYDKYFWPDNATVVIVGDIDATNAANLVGKYFGPISKSPAPITRWTTTESTQSERRVSLKYPGKSEVLQVAYRAPAMDDADAPAMVVLEKVLNGGLSGRLKGRLIDSKLSTSSAAAYEIKKEPGLFTITSTAVPATYGAQQKLLEAVDGVMAQLKEKPPADAELRRAKNHAEYDFQSECDGPYRAGFHLGYFHTLSQWQSARTWADRLRTVSSADVQRVAKKYFSSDSRVVGWIAGNQAPKASPPKPLEGKDASHDKNTAIRPQIGHVQLAAFKESDSSTAPEQEAKQKKNGIPALINNIPSALGHAVTGNIPGAVGNVGNVILNVPSAIGDISKGVATTATVIGKQIGQLIPGSDQSSARVSRRVLKNGITLLVFESHLAPVVQVSGSLESGDAYNPSGKPGVSAVSAALLNQGSAKRSRSQMQATQDDLGIPSYHMLNFKNQLESIDFHTRCLSRDLPGQLELLCETLSSPSFDDAVLDKSKQEAMSQVKRGSEDVTSRVDRVMMQSLLAENSSFCPADPTDKAKSITTVTEADLQKFFSQHVVPGSATIVMAGDIDPDQAASMAEKAFSRWPGKPGHGRLHAHANPKRVLRTSLPLSTPKSTICFGSLIPLAQSHQDFGSLMIADGILINHPMISRFERAVAGNQALEKNIAETGVDYELTPFSNQSKWTLAVAVDPQSVSTAVKTIKGELRNLAKNGVAADEFTEVRRYLVGSIAVKEQSTLTAVCDSICEAAEHGDIADGYNTRLSSIRAATVESVNKIIRNVFKPETATLVVAGPAQTIKDARTTGSGTSEE